MITYENVIPLETAKNFLRVDCYFTEDDNDIKRMCKSALQYIEKFTNHILETRDIEYFKGGFSYIDVFDYPINSTIPDENCKQVFSGKTRIHNADSITLNVGYTTSDQVPSALIDCALQIVEEWYYNKESKYKTDAIPEHVKDVLWQYKRFITIS